MQAAEIPFGEFLPDQPTYKNPGCIAANNVFPISGGYGPFAGGNPQGDTNTEAVRGAAQMFRNDGTSIVVGGSDTILFILVGGTLTATGSLNSIGADNYWDFAQFNDYVFAVSENNNPKYLSDIDSDTSWSDAPGSPPEAKVIGRVGYFLMVGNLTDLGLPTTLQWSAENDPTDWPTPGTNDARLKQSSRVALQPEYGEITGIAGDRFPMVFQQRAISRIDPVGPPTVFRITPIEEARGCIAPQSIVTVGFQTYFLSHDGFWMTDGNSVQPIGNSRINQWFFDNVSETDRFRTQGTVVWEKQAIIWNFYPASEATGFKRQIIYSFKENRWSTASLTCDWIVDNKVGATTLEDLDALFADLESVDPDLDSSYWGARSRVLSAFIQNGSAASELNLLNGDSLEAQFQTGEMQPAPGKRVECNGAFPVVEDLEDAVMCGASARENKGSTQTSSSTNTINGAGFCPFRIEGRYVSGRMVIPAGTNWNKAQGMQLEFRTTGAR